MRPYVIRPGDCLSRLAAQGGFSADAVWNDPKNASLKALRGHMDILAPGDIAYLPDDARAPADLVVGGTNRFKSSVPTVRIQLVVRYGSGPLVNEPFVASGLGAERNGQTDDAGAVRLDVPVLAREFTLTFPRKRFALPVCVGQLDPIDSARGVQQRLEHLGMCAPRHRARATRAESDAARIRESEAISAFQRKERIPITGEVDDATRERLVAAHGS